MLTRNSTWAVVGMASELASRGVSLSPLGDTPLQLLVDASTCLKQRNRADNEPVMEFSDQLVKDSAVINFNGENQHGVYLGEYVDLASNAVATSVDIARNQINPMSEELVKVVDAAMSRATLKKDAFKIKVVVQPAILKNSALDELTARYSESVVSLPEWSGDDWPALSVDVLKVALKSGVRRIDSDLDKLIKSLGDDQIAMAYEYIFRKRSIDAVMDTTTLSLLAFFWSENWLRELPEGLLGELGNVNGMLTALKASSGRTVQKAMDQHERSLRYQMFILKMPSVDNRGMPIEVLADVYNQWLKAGGTPELLMGAALSGQRPGFNISDTQRQQWTRAYNNDLRTQEYALNTRIKEAVMSAVREYAMAEIDAQEPTFQAEAREDFFKFLEQRPYRTDMDIQSWSRELLAITFFPGTNALKILQGVDEIIAKHSDMTPREAATFAAMDVMADYLVSMMHVRCQ